MLSQFKYIFILLLSVLCFSSCEEDNYADWKILNKSRLENLKEENKDNPDFVVTESGLCYEIIHPGFYTKPNINSSVRVKYTVKYITGKTVESSTFENYLSNAVSGWQEAIPKIKRGGRMLLYVPANLAYGDDGSGAIPPYSTLIFDLELIDVINYY